jgi:macrodomain Ter protein organizer (MatP/YcbG family)
MSNTPKRSIRISDVLWQKVCAKAKEEETTVSAVVIRLLRAWLKE